ncbi:MAG: T9SS type A sorting domain-containing protein, partial [Bacteroidota bacterium]
VDDFGLIRYNEDGTLDQSFGTGGRVATDFFQSRNTAHSILLQEDGKIILGGFAGTNPNRNFAIARYDETGQLDETFGNSGKVSTDFGFNDFLFTMTLQADGKLLGAGHSVTANDASLFSIARYNTRTGTSVQDFIPSIDLVELFPNPSQGECTLWFESAQSTTAAISLINAKGQLVQNISDAHKIIEGVNQLDFSLADQMGAGVFFLKIATSEGTLFKKLIVMR